MENDDLKYKVTCFAHDKWKSKPSRRSSFLHLPHSHLPQTVMENDDLKYKVTRFARDNKYKSNLLYILFKFLYLELILK